MRFFQLEDLMIKKNYEEMLHVEADNLLYGNVTSILNTLRSGSTSLYSKFQYIYINVMTIT